MRKNILFKILLTFILIHSATLTFTSPTTEAAKATTKSYAWNPNKVYTYDEGYSHITYT